MLFGAVARGLGILIHFAGSLIFGGVALRFLIAPSRQEMGLQDRDMVFAWLGLSALALLADIASNAAWLQIERQQQG